MDYNIERKLNDRWHSYGVEFQYMSPSYARGAWAMLVAHQGGNNCHFRMIETQTGKVVQEFIDNTIKLNASTYESLDFKSEV